MELKYQLLIVASIMTYGVIENAEGFADVNEYSDQGRPTDSPLEIFLTLDNARNFHKQNAYRDMLNKPSDSLSIVEESGDIPFRLITPDEKESNNIGREKSMVPDVAESAYNNNIYSHLKNNRMVALNDESAVSEPSINEEHEFRNMLASDDDVYSFNSYPASRTILRFDGYPKNAKRTREKFSSELSTKHNSEDSIFKIPTKRFFGSYWKSIFGHRRDRNRARGKTDDRNERKRDRHFGNRFSYFDTLASRIIGK